MEGLPLLKLVFLLQIITISILPLQPCPALGQQQMTDMVYGWCNRGTFDTNSSFAHNLYSVLGNLTQRSSRSLYSSATVTSGSSNASLVYAMYQCRGDLSFSECYACASPLLGTNLCGPAMGMRVQLKGCYARYENYNFLAVAEDTLVTSNCSATQSTNSLYKANLAIVLNATAKAAPAHAVFGFNASSVGKGGSTTAYALAQCVGYLSPSQCQSCLSQVSEYTTLCKDSVAGLAYFVTCFYLFDNAPLLFTTASPAPEASPPKPASRVPQASIISPSSGTIFGFPKSPSQVQSKKRSTVPIVVGIVLGVFLLLAATAVLAGLCSARRRRRAKLAQQSKTTDANAALPYKFQQGATKFSLEELREATDDFHPRNKLGQGGFGPVYKGKLKTGREVAIKSLSAESRQGKAEFMNAVNLITNVQHRNLIQLLGRCVEESDRLLVYEYLPNRSLDLLLFDVGHNDHGIGLDWHTRFDIIVGIARGLCYLHEDSHVRIVHRDIKASNILLDNNLNPKIADFGLARFFADDVTHLTTRVAGTLGYLAPEYAINGQLTQKADVYSFGLVALEIVSGRKVIEHRLEPEKQHLLEWAWALYERQQQLQIVDAKLSNRGMVNAGEAIRVVHVALLCTQTSAQARPAMSQVYTMLCGQSEILELPTKPTIIGMDSPYNQVPFTNSSSTSATWHSDPSQTAPPSNRVSISEIDAR